MAGCSDYPTAQGAKDFAINSKVQSEVATSTALLTPSTATDGHQKKTLFAYNNEFSSSLAIRESEFDIAISAIDGVNLGTYSENKTFTAYNQYVTFTRSGVVERWSIRPSIPLGYTIDSATTPDPINDSSHLYPSYEVTDESVDLKDKNRQAASAGGYGSQQIEGNLAQLIGQSAVGVKFIYFDDGAKKTYWSSISELTGTMTGFAVNSQYKYASLTTSTGNYELFNIDADYYKSSASQIGLVFSGVWHPNLLIPSGSYTAKLGYWVESKGIFYSTSSDAEFTTGATFAADDALNLWISNDVLTSVVGVRVFDNVEEMKLSNLSLGQLVRTNGFYEVGDGGGSNYIAVKDPTFPVDGLGITYFSSGQIFVELLDKEKVSTRQIGCLGNSTLFDGGFTYKGVHYPHKQWTDTVDETHRIQFIVDNFSTVIIDYGNYYLLSNVNITKPNLTIKGLNKKTCLLINSALTVSHTANNVLLSSFGFQGWLKDMVIPLPISTDDSAKTDPTKWYYQDGKLAGFSVTAISILAVPDGVNPNGITIEDCYFEGRWSGCEGAAGLGLWSNIKFINNETYNIYYHGMASRSCSDCLVEGNTFSRHWIGMPYDCSTGSSSGQLMNNVGHDLPTFFKAESGAGNPNGMFQADGNNFHSWSGNDFNYYAQYIFRLSGEHGMVTNNTFNWYIDRTLATCQLNAQHMKVSDNKFNFKYAGRAGSIIQCKPYTSAGFSNMSLEVSDNLINSDSEMGDFILLAGGSYNMEYLNVTDNVFKGTGTYADFIKFDGTDSDVLYSLRVVGNSYTGDTFVGSGDGVTVGHILLDSNEFTSRTGGSFFLMSGMNITESIHVINNVQRIKAGFTPDLNNRVNFIRGRGIDADGSVMYVCNNVVEFSEDILYLLDTSTESSGKVPHTLVYTGNVFTGVGTNTNNTQVYIPKVPRVISANNSFISAYTTTTTIFEHLPSPTTYEVSYQEPAHIGGYLKVQPD